jgi:hypothetical protein
MLNELPAKSEIKYPRGLLTLNDQSVKWIDFTVSETTYYSGDSFRVTLPTRGQPAGIDINYFSSEPAFILQVFSGFPFDPFFYSRSELDNLILGQVDDLEIDPINGTIILSGRDLTAKFIDNKTYEKFANMRASDIAILLARRRGLNPVVTPTSTIVGQYYQIDSAKINSLQTEWDLLTFLAQEENFAVYVQGMDLHFEPVPTETGNPYVFQFTPESLLYATPTFNGTSLKVGRNMTLSKDIIVKVRSWNMKYKKGFTATARARNKKGRNVVKAAEPAGDPQEYVYNFPGLSKQQAQQKALSILQKLSQHERRVEIEAPGDNLIRKKNIIRVTGTQTDFDQVYFPASITRSMSAQDKYTMSISAKNHSPNSQVLV